MPYYKALSYIHVYNIRNGLATEWKRAEGGKKAITLEQFTDALKK